jgi:hypothetical protein
MRNNTGDLNMGTKVISAVVSPRPSDELEEPVEMTFEKNIVSTKMNKSLLHQWSNSKLWRNAQCNMLIGAY